MNPGFGPLKGNHQLDGLPGLSISHSLLSTSRKKAQDLGPTKPKKGPLKASACNRQAAKQRWGGGGGGETAPKQRLPQESMREM